MIRNAPHLRMQEANALDDVLCDLHSRQERQFAMESRMEILLESVHDQENRRSVRPVIIVDD